MGLTLLARRDPLASSATQRARLAAARTWPPFGVKMAATALAPLHATGITVFQINVGKFCNQTCRHCHVDAGPERAEQMTRETAELCIAALARTDIPTVDITGGAPELNANFRWLVERARALSRHVMDRCNLSVLLLKPQADLAAFLAAHQVELVASLPCYGAANVDKQRGVGVFEKSVAALHRLNALGYGIAGSPLRLDLVYNPVGAFLPPPQATLEADYRAHLASEYGIAFHRLLTIANMPISRFAADLERSGRAAEYMSLLVNHFNPATVPGLMCRELVSIGYDGRLYDCDFNQMLELPLGAGVKTIWDLERIDALDGAPIATGPHCFGCTAGAGSSCGGALA